MKHDGEYRLDGKLLNKNEDLYEIRNSDFGFVFQMYNLIESYSALENILLPLSYCKKNYLNKEYLDEITIELQIKHLLKVHMSTNK